MFIKGKVPTSIKETASQTRNGSAAVVSMPKSMKLGKSIQGQVVSINGKEIELLLNGNTKISAHIEQDMQVSLKQILNFEVQQKSDSVILRPLFENLAGDANVAKALEVANMPRTSENIQMVTDLMERGLPVDKASLQEMSRFMNTNPRATGNVLVQMKEFQIPFSNENINQFVAYKGMEHYISDAVTELSAAVTDGLGQLTSEGEFDLALSSFSKLNQLFASKVDGSLSSLDLHMNANQEITSGAVQNTEQMTELQHVTQMEDIRLPLEGKDSTNIEANIVQKSFVSEEGNILENVKNEIRNLKLPENIQNQLNETQGDLQKTLQIVTTYFQKTEDKTQIQQFMKSDVFTKSIQFLLQDGMYLKPEEFGDKEAVKELYKSIKDQVDVLHNISESMGKAGESVQSTAAAINQNLDFVNQINQVFNYIQIPLKDSENSAKGELFVYAKKKSTLEQGESVSALLHLDMRNLGTLDIKVNMTNEKVQTNFFLEEESTLDFISEHLPELDAAIARRGYQVSSQASINEEKHDSITSLIEKEEANASYFVSNQSFDARA